MKFSEKWLREWVNPSLSTNELTDLLTMGGMEVDSVAPAAPEFFGVVVAKIVSAECHPDADKLQLCKVDFGGDEPVDIVCGAANAREGLITALATVGAVLPGGMKIKEAKLRGIPSFGMLSSASELGLAEKAEGIIELSADAKLGQDLREYFDLDDTIIEVDLTPNRGDCFSLRGVARDVGVLSQADVTEPEIDPVKTTSDQTFPIEIQSPEACPNYAGRIISGINANVETPLWMQERLRRSGLRSIHPVVDITNYVMLELGQPLHAFDLAKLKGGIVVRNAKEGEKLTLLDDQEIELNSDTLVIADQERVLALAGVMGGLDSSVTDHTQDIFLESAFFTPAEMAGKARRYKVQTDSSHRFERGVDFQLQTIAIERASSLILEICGGDAGSVSVESNDSHLPPRSAILLRKDRISRVLGVEFDDAFIESSLERLGMSIKSGKSEWMVMSPSHRFDIAIEADLIEEIARVEGYDGLPANKPLVSMSIKARAESQIELRNLSSIMIAKGYQEAITYSFVEPEMQASLCIGHEAVALANPISADMAVMRTSLLPGLLQALTYNLNRQNERVRLFENGMVFCKVDGETVQKNVFAGIVSGNVFPEQWNLKSSQPDFFDLKSDVEALLLLSGNLSDYEFKKVEHSALHPGQSAAIYKKGQNIGFMGMISPVKSKELDLDAETGFFQLDLTAITDGKLPQFSTLSKYPLVRRDLSLLVDKDIEVSSIISCINGKAPETLKNLQLFDVYQGEGIDSMKKSVALGLIFQGTSSTLVEQEIDASLENILLRLEKELGCKLRD